MAWITDPGIWIALLTLTSLEIVLGIDNVVFISILAGKLPPEQQNRARQTGLGLAVVSRILLLLSISWIIQLTGPLLPLSIQNNEALPEAVRHFSGRDLILLGGGLFLLYKATREIHERLEGETGHASARVAASFASVIAQILVLDVVFSLDSVITAVGMANEIGVMIAAVVIAVGIMLFAAGPISDFVNRHPTVKMLALSFLLLIGVNLIVEALHVHIPKGYIYFAMGFSVLVEALNLRAAGRKKKVEPVHLHEPYAAAVAAGGPGASPAAQTAAARAAQAAPPPQKPSGQGGGAERARKNKKKNRR
jgi:predicted tellurium resistance membrane protein TerC